MAVQIRECQNRSADITVQEWCAAHGLTKAASSTADADNRTFSRQQDSLCITAGNCCIQVTQDTSKELLSMVLEVINNAQ